MPEEPSALSKENARAISELRQGQTDQRALLERIDERTISTAADLKEMRRDIVTRPEFTPVRLIAYGLVAILGSSVVGALMWFIVNSQGGG